MPCAVPPITFLLTQTGVTTACGAHFGGGQREGGAYLEPIPWVSMGKALEIHPRRVIKNGQGNGHRIAVLPPEQKGLGRLTPVNRL